jgi:calcineurin-like phosphoesterase family protein
MSETFLIADLHLGHRNIVKFTDKNGNKVRPWDDLEEMNEAIISNWNSVVRKNDRVNLLGDAVINRSCIPLLGRLNGRIRLIAGNHDEFRPSEYLEYVDDIKSSITLDGFVLTHIPIHPKSLERWRGNIHGHLHQNIVTLDNGLPDNRYLSVSCEQINFTPISLSDLKKKHNYD